MKDRSELEDMVKVKFEKEDQLGVITFMDKPLNHTSLY